MDIVKLPAGQFAPEDVDCIRIQELPEGMFALTGTVLLQCGDGEASESVALIGGEPYRSYEEAESAGLTWADQHCVEVIHVTRSEGTKPLPDFA